jgi:photosystem II stability/assembly factor-like uncharacterized protein
MSATRRPSRVYAGAGHWVDGAGVRHPGGLFRRTSGDGQWRPLTTGLPGNVEARAFCVDPRDPDVLYVGTQDGPYRSTDGGEHWERPGFPDRGAVIWSLARDPARPNVMYAGTAPVAIYRSEDGGESWCRLAGAKSPGHCEMGFPTRVIRLAVDPVLPDVVYAALEVSGVMRSDDGGETWKDLSAPLIRLAEAPHLKSRIGSDIDAEGMLDSHALAVSAAAPGTAFLAVRMGLFRSDDRGTTWRDIEVGRYSPLTYCRDVLVSPHDERVMYACLSVASRSSNGSLYRSEDLGATWRRFDHGVTVRGTMMAVAADARDPARVCCVSRCGQVFGTEDGGASWAEYPLPAGVEDVYAVACA